jgi:hypothetical protein
VKGIHFSITQPGCYCLFHFGFWTKIGVHFLSCPLHPLWFDHSKTIEEYIDDWNLIEMVDSSPTFGY